MLFIHPEDLAALGLQDGERVEIETLWNDGVVRKVDGFKLVSYDIPRGNGGLLPGNQPAGAAGQLRRRYRYPDLEVDSGDDPPQRTAAFAAHRLKTRARFTPGAPISRDGLQLVRQLMPSPDKIQVAHPSSPISTTFSPGAGKINGSSEPGTQATPQPACTQAAIAA